MAIAKSEKAQLARFGCFLKAKESTLCIDLPKNRLEEVRNAQMLLRFVSPKLEGGQIFCLALEISPSRFLPRYCYYPFDLTRPTHRKVMETILDKGLLKCAFVGASKKRDRIVTIPPHHLPRIRDLYRGALSRLEELGPAAFDFNNALAELEATERIPNYFARVFSENELADVVASVREHAETVPSEKRALARQFFEGLFEVLRTRYPGDVRLLFDNLEAWQGFVQVVADLYRDYGQDYQTIVQALADLGAITSEKGELENLAPLPRAVDSVCELLERVRSSPEADRIEILHRVGPFLEEIRGHLAAGAGLSQKVLRGTLPLLGTWIRGKPGRRPQDYSAEYDLKASGLSWREVAMRALENRPGLREEFGNRKFEDLDLRQQLALRQRIRVGVENYAERTSRPLPPLVLSPRNHEGEE